MQFERLYQFVVGKLRDSLPAYLSYHNVDHTIHVVNIAAEIAANERLTDMEINLVKTAALLHDTGFMQTHENHEELSCRYAKKILPDFEYTEEQIEHICSMILATRIPQNPHDLFARILCDADLYYLGAKDYTETAEKLKKEMVHLGVFQSTSSWLDVQIRFLSEHKYFTNYAVAHREQEKQRNLESLLAQQTASTPHKSLQATSHFLLDFIVMLLGVTLAAIALKGFLMPNLFFDGGITGIALLLHETTHLHIGIFLISLNLPLIIAGYFMVNLRFALRMALAIILLVIVLQLLPDFAMTKDKLLISIFGGVFIGSGVGLVMRSGAALDGIEVVALYTLKRTSFTITEIILGINILIFSIAAFKFGIETALYSILTYFTATRCIDYVVEGIQAYTGVTIISSKSEVIKYQLVNKMGKGITIYKGERGFLPGKYGISNDCDIIFTIITRLELRRLKNMVAEIDPNAFVFANTIKEALGGVVKRIQHH